MQIPIDTITNMRSASPIIGIPCRVTEQKSDRLSADLDSHALPPPFVGVRESYIDFVTDAGGTPLLIPLLTDPRMLRRLYAKVDALFFTGGEDIDPSRYHERVRQKLRPEPCPERDIVEFQLIEWAKEDRKPVLGICRGLQLINVSLGGTLFQDLEREFPNDPLRPVINHNEEERWNDIIHQLQIEPQTRLSDMLKIDQQGSIGANSAHHQGINRLGEGLRISAINPPDGVIEGIESIDPNFLCIGVQSHPELIYKKVEPRWENLFREFISLCA
jgi:putative glutamine amidotransferase